MAHDDPVNRRLSQVLPKLEFSGIAFADAIQFVRDVSNLCIYVSRGALVSVGVDRSTAVNVKLSDVSLGKALQTILDDVSAVTPLSLTPV